MNKVTIGKMHFRGSRIHRPKKMALFAAFVFLICGLGATFAVVQSNHQTSVGCNERRKRVRELTISKNFGSGYAEMKNIGTVCYDSHASQNQISKASGKGTKAEAVSEYADMAKGAYLAGDKALAKQIAESGESMLKTMSDQERVGKLEYVRADLSLIRAGAPPTDMRSN